MRMSLEAKTPDARDTSGVLIHFGNQRNKAVGPSFHRPGFRYPEAQWQCQIVPVSRLE